MPRLKTVLPNILSNIEQRKISKTSSSWRCLIMHHAKHKADELAFPASALQNISRDDLIVCKLSVKPLLSNFFRIGNIWKLRRYVAIQNYVSLNAKAASLVAESRCFRIPLVPRRHPSQHPLALLLQGYKPGFGIQIKLDALVHFILP